jgi:hypothetical protein
VVIGIAEEKDIALSIGMFAISGSIDDSYLRIQLQTHGGTHSDTRLCNGTVMLSVSGSSDVGRRGEPAALKTFLAVLRDQGLRPSILDSSDNRGEDAVIEIANSRYTVQLVTVPSDPSFWRDAARGLAETAAGIESALGWIREAILAKFHATSPKERPRTVLVLDVHHAGVLASKHISDAYLSRYPDPRDEFNFVATWLIGPVVSSSTQMGSASWRQ